MTSGRRGISKAHRCTILTACRERAGVRRRRDGACLAVRHRPVHGPFAGTSAYHGPPAQDARRRIVSFVRTQLTSQGPKTARDSHPMDEAAAMASVNITRPATERSHPAGHQMRSTAWATCSRHTHMTRRRPSAGSHLMADRARDALSSAVRRRHGSWLPAVVTELGEPRTDPASACRGGMGSLRVVVTICC